MAKRVLVLVGTRKGLFILESTDRASWRIKGPHCETWPINHAVADPATGNIYAGGGNPWFGPAVWKSADFGETWTHSSDGLAYEAGQEPISSVWSVGGGNGRSMRACSRPACSEAPISGETWQHVRGLSEHPSRPHWQPGGAGLILHSLLVDPADDNRMWVGISAVGVFCTEDGGASLGAAQPRDPQRLSAGGPAISRIRAVRAFDRAGTGLAGPALPAEPLRDVPQRRRRPRAG